MHWWSTPFTLQFWKIVYWNMLSLIYFHSILCSSYNCNIFLQQDCTLLEIMLINTARTLLMHSLFWICVKIYCNSLIALLHDPFLDIIDPNPWSAGSWLLSASLSTWSIYLHYIFLGFSVFHHIDCIIFWYYKVSCYGLWIYLICLVPSDLWPLHHLCLYWVWE